MARRTAYLKESETVDKDYKDERSRGLRCLAKIIACHHTKRKEHAGAKSKALKN